jgi:hypothetical protein
LIRISSGAEYKTEDRESVPSDKLWTKRLTGFDPMLIAACDFINDKNCNGFDDYLKQIRQFSGTAAGTPIVMDLVYDRESKSYKILEFNSFWSSGIYGNSVDSVVNAIAETL